MPFCQNRILREALRASLSGTEGGVLTEYRDTAHSLIDLAAFEHGEIALIATDHPVKISENQAPPGTIFVIIHGQNQSSSFFSSAYIILPAKRTPFQQLFNPCNRVKNPFPWHKNYISCFYIKKSCPP